MEAAQCTMRRAQQPWETGACGSDAQSKVTSRPFGSISRKVANTSMLPVEDLTQSLSLIAR
jgi:hypothetical protein